MGFASIVCRLIKYKLSLAVTLSAVAGYFLFSGNSGPGLPFLICGVFCLAGGSAALNQVQEHKQDALMNRTCGRPIPSGKISPGKALVLAIGLCTGGSLILWESGNLPVLLGLLNLFLYNGLYTPLKTRSSFAVLPGGLVGAIPPLMGWTAAGGPVFHPVILFVATLMFLWQLPHFWLLIIRFGKEYEAAGFATLKRRLDDSQIKRLVFWWMAVSSVFLLTAPMFGISLKTWMFIALTFLNLVFIGFFYVILFRSNSEKMLRLVFMLTNVFLMLVLLGLIVNSVINKRI